MRRNGAEAGQHTQKRKANSKDILLILLAIVTVASLVVAIWAVSTRNSPAKNPLSQEETKEPVEKLTDSIDYPGYRQFVLISDTLEQNLTIPNPEQNYCYIKASLILENGTLLWTSDLIEPGKESAPVVLTQTLSKGEHNATLKYEAFTMDEALTQLNGADMPLILLVK